MIQRQESFSNEWVTVPGAGKNCSQLLETEIVFCDFECIVKGAGIVITLVAVLINLIIGYLQ